MARRMVNLLANSLTDFLRLGSGASVHGHFKTLHGGGATYGAPHGPLRGTTLPTYKATVTDVAEPFWLLNRQPTETFTFYYFFSFLNFYLLFFLF